MTSSTHPHIHLFIHRENQTILWNVIRTSAMWPTFSKSALKMSVEQWFRQMIESKYAELLDTYNPLSLDIKTPTDPVAWLRETNKDMLRRLTASMTSYISAEITTQQRTVAGFPNHMDMPTNININNNNTQIPSANNYIPANTAVENPTLVYSAPRNYDTPTISVFDVEKERKEKQEKAKLEFEAYQSQYKSLLVRNAPTTPVFSENLQLDKIKNMDELLKQQREARDRDAQLVSSEPLPAPENAGFSREPQGSFVDRDNIKQEVMNVFLLNTQEVLSYEDKSSSSSLTATLSNTRTPTLLRNSGVLAVPSGDKKSVSWEI